MPSRNQHPSPSGLITAALLIILSCIAVFGQSVTYDFLNLDDNMSVTLDPAVHDGLTFEGIHKAFTTFGNPYYMPLTRISFLVDSSLFGLEPFGFHLTNLVLHTLNALLVMVLLWLLSRRLDFALVTALLFALHPQHIEAFVWISERKEVLASLFGLLSFCCYVVYVNRRQQNIASYRSAYLSAVLCFLVSLLAKPAWITLPFALLLIDVWPLGRHKRDSVRLILLDKLPFVLLIALSISITLYSAASDVDQVSNSAQTLPLFQRLQNSAVVYVTYLRYTLYPVNLPVYYPYPLTPLPSWQIFASTLFLTAVTAMLVRARRGLPQLLTGWLWFLGTLVPMVGIISAGESVFIGNRWTYIAHIGLFAALAWTGLSWYDRFPAVRTWLRGMALLIISAMAVSSFQQTAHWRNSETYWQQAIRTTVENHMAHYMLGTHYLDLGRIDDAIKEMETAYRMQSNEAIYALMLGNAYARSGQTDRAWEYYATIIRTGAPNVKLLVEMGLASLAANRADMAAEFFRAALASPVVMPHHHRYRYLSMLYAAHAQLVLGDHDGASANIERFLEVDTDREALCRVAQAELYVLSHRFDPSATLKLVQSLCQKI